MCDLSLLLRVLLLTIDSVSIILDRDEHVLPTQLSRGYWYLVTQLIQTGSQRGGK